MIEEINKRIEQKLIKKTKHPTEDLYIYNYTQKCQFERAWDKYTMMCRGLIMNGKNEIVARPFEKFFNLGEYEGKLPDGDFRIYDKLDGSLGILYWIGNIPCIATRGSFTSEQAIKGTEMLQRLKGGFDWLDRSKTYLFEIIYPENRIVVNYGKEEVIILLAIIDTKTGEEIDYDFTPFPSVDEHFKEMRPSIADLKGYEIDNSEGYVIRWDNGFRLKIKFDEYVRLHRLLTGLNEKKIWEILRNGDTLNEVLERVPDEFFEWVIERKEKLEKRFRNLSKKARKLKREVKKFKTRKEQAEYIFSREDGKEISGIVFAILDKKDYKSRIWKMIKPEANIPFKIEK